MATIYKYSLNPALRYIEMPKGAEILCVQMQKGVPFLWAKVDPSAECESRAIRVYGTGYELKGLDSHYIGTFQMNNGSLVFHVFEEKI